MKSNLTPHEREVYDILRGAAGRFVSGEEITSAIYGAAHLQTDSQNVKIYIYRLRRRGYRIINARGVGYALADAGPCPTCGRPFDQEEEGA